MAMISVTCVVDVRAADFDESRLERILAALDEVDAVARLEIDASSVPAAPRDSSFRIQWATGGIAALRAWSKLGRQGPSYATLDVDGRASPRAYLDVLEELFDAGICPLVRSVPPHGVQAVEELHKWRAPILAACEGDAPDVAPIGMMSHRARLLPDGALAGGPPVPIWEMDAASLRSALGEREGSLFVPCSPWCFPLPDGSKLRQFLGGGAMATSHLAAQLECQASLGFDDRQAFEGWGAEVTRNEAQADGLPVDPGWGGPPSRPFDDEQRLSVRALRHSFASGIVLASALLRGDRAEVEAMVGLHLQLTGANGFGEGPDIKLIDLTDPAIARRQEEVARHGLALVASACGLIALCRAPLEARKAAAKTLAFLGVARAEKVAHWVESRAEADAELVRLSRRVWRNAPGERVREQMRQESEPQRIAQHLEKQVDKLLRSLTGAR